jgi:hypothetical protein
MEIDGKKVSILCTLITSLLCGLPGLALCLMSGLATAGLSTESLTPDELAAGGLGVLMFSCLGIFLLAVPVILAFFTFRQRKG